MKFDEVSFEQIEDMLMVRAGVDNAEQGHCKDSGCSGPGTVGHCGSGCSIGGSCVGGCGPGFPKTPVDVDPTDPVIVGELPVGSF